MSYETQSSNKSILVCYSVLYNFPFRVLSIKQWSHLFYRFYRLESNLFLNIILLSVKYNNKQDLSDSISIFIIILREKTHRNRCFKLCFAKRQEPNAR